MMNSHNDEHDEPEQDSYPPAHTFKTRRRGLKGDQVDSLQQLEQRYGVALSGPLLDFESIPTVLDIGIGFGDAAIQMASADHNTQIIGCDVHTPGILATLLEVEARNIANLRVVHGDVLEFVRRIPLGSLAAIRLYFPDPWPKARHRHRRMMTEERLGQLVSLLVPGGHLHVATDIADYALQTERICGQHPELTGGPIQRPEWRPVTKFERKAQLAGREIVDLLFIRSAKSLR